MAELEKFGEHSQGARIAVSSQLRLEQLLRFSRAFQTCFPARIHNSIDAHLT